MSKRHVHLHAGRWSRVRRRVFARDGYRCRTCGKAGKLECDHVVPLERGGEPWALSNLQTICRACHIEKTRGENERQPSPDELAWRAELRKIFS